jgi:hypothetical protein
MLRRPRNAARRTLLALGLLFAARSVAADLVWRVADEGPRAPDEVEILGDESRTIAFGPEGDWELRGTEWRPVPLRTTEIVGRKRTLFFAQGRFGALAQDSSTCLVQLFTLRGDTWTRVWSDTACWTLVRSEERLYVPLWDPFVGCSCETGPGAAPESRRFRSVSLVDGTVREEAPLPWCVGTLFVLSGKVHLIATPPVCGGPSTREVQALASGPPYAFYRLDEGSWTRLPDWTLPPWTLLSTPNSLWVVDGSIEVSARILTAKGLSDPVAFPREFNVNPRDPGVLEWNGRFVAMSREARGNIYVLEGNRLVRLAPESPLSVPYRGPRVSVAGNRLFTSAEGWDAHVLDGSAWRATTGPDGRAGARKYVMGGTKTFALRGSRLFRRDATGWARLPYVSSAGYTELVGVWKERPLVADRFGSGSSWLIAHDRVSDAWTDLGVPPGFSGPVFGAGEDLYVGGPPGKVARRRGDSWTVLEASPLPTGSCAGYPEAFRQVEGRVYVLSSGPCGIPRRDDDVYRIEDGWLVPAFTSLDRSVFISDVIESDGSALLQVFDRREGTGPKAVLLRPVGERFDVLATQEDLIGSGRYSITARGVTGGPGSSSFDGLRLEQGRLLQQRGGAVPSVVDLEGRFAWGDRFRFGLDDVPDPLLVPEFRVRKQLAAVVDTTGHGGTRYRSELTLANLSPGMDCVAKLYPGPATKPSREVPLPAGTQVRIVDPVPGFVGPLAVEFEGLSDDRDAWAAVRVFSPSEGGTSGTSILGTDPGHLAGQTELLRPVATPGSRLHLAISTARDGSDLGVYYRADPGQIPGAYPNGLFPAGSFVQYDPDAARVSGPLRIEASSPWLGPKADARNDLLGYFVRNDGVTNDGTVVPFEEPDVLPGRRTRFLPAVVGVTSEHGTYRTELTFGRRERWGTAGVALPFLVTYRGDEVTKTLSIGVGSDAIVEVPDAGAWLVANGVPIDPRDFNGTLTFSSERWEGAADLLVTAVVQARAPGAKGDYGVSVPVVNEVRWAKERAVVPGLREDGAFRSNLALANPEAVGGPVVMLEVTLYRASDGEVIGTLPRVTLAAGRRLQLNRPLRQVGYGGDAWAEVRRVGGAGRFVAYGVVNDASTSDGTLLPMAGAR